MARLVAIQIPRSAVADELEHVWGQGDAALVLPEDATRPVIEQQLARFRPTALRTEHGEVGLPAPLALDDEVALVVATSGSTGTPRGVALSHRALRHSVEASVARLGARPGEPFLLALPTHHIAGVSVLLRARALGSPVLIAKDTDEVADHVAAGAAHVSLVPTQLERLLDAGAPLARLRTVLLGGAPAQEALLQRAAAASVPIVRSYGMSETCGGCVYDGLPLDGVEVAVGDDARIRLRGPVLLSGWLPAEQDPTGPLDSDGWFTTSDLGRLEPDGTGTARLTVLGRADDVLISGGENVPLAVVQSLLAEHPQVAEVAVIAMADPRWGQVPAAVVVPTVRHDPPTLAALRDHVGRRAPAAYRPGQLAVTDALPRGPLGKVTRQALERLLHDQGPGADEG